MNKRNALAEIEAANREKRGAYLRYAYLVGADLEGANLRGAYLEGAYLGGANLGGADLEDANLRCADLGGANLRYAYLEDANLENANLENTNLGRANLGGANLRGAYLEDANLENTNLGRANLRGAYLEDANLENANLENTNLGRANLRNTCLDPAAPIPPISDKKIAAAGLELRTVKGRQRVYGWRTQVSQYVGRTEYRPRRWYRAPYFSVAQTPCHPGLYLSGKDDAREIDSAIVRVWCYRDELHHAGTKWRARRLYVIGGADDTEQG